MLRNSNKGHNIFCGEIWKIILIFVTPSDLEHYQRGKKISQKNKICMVFQIKVRFDVHSDSVSVQVAEYIFNFS